MLVTNGLSKLEWKRDAYRDSPLHLTIRYIHKGRFLMGNFTDNGCPGIPLEPEIFEQAENFEVSWVEIEFETRRGWSLITYRCLIIGTNRSISILLTCPNTGLNDFRGLCDQVLAEARVSM